MEVRLVRLEGGGLHKETHNNVDFVEIVMSSFYPPEEIHISSHRDIDTALSVRSFHRAITVGPEAANSIRIEPEGYRD